MKSKNGQNVAEYLILTAAVLFVFLLVLGTRQSPMRTALDNVFNDAVRDIDVLNTELKFPVAN